MSPVDHIHETASPPTSVSVTLPPSHVEQSSGSHSISHVGRSYTTTVVFALPWHPFSSVTVNVYTPATAGLTITHCKLLVKLPGPVHLNSPKVVFPQPCSITSSPGHTGPSLNGSTVGPPNTVTVCEHQPKQPVVLFPTFTQYVVLLPGETTSVDWFPTMVPP